jgi:hypothetical protein
MEKGIQSRSPAQFSGMPTAGAGDDGAVSDRTSGLSLRVVQSGGRVRHEEQGRVTPRIEDEQTY